jgi:hypothetical protein
MSNEQLKAEIMNAVSKSLPAMQVDALKAELAKATEVDGLRNQAKDSEKLITDLKVKLYEQNTLDQKLRDADTRLATALAKERQLELDLLKKDYACEQRVTQNLKELMQTVFRNPSYTTSKSQEVADTNNVHNKATLYSNETKTID